MIHKTRFPFFSWGVLIYNLGVILFGAYVRATGSGAGCGSHWPLCNGEVLPQSPALETIIEFSHRVSSGIALLLVIVLFVWAHRVYPREHPARFGAKLSLLFIITEALVGAGLVLFEWVGTDTSASRAVSISVHLVNTFLLLAALTLVSWWSSSGKKMILTGQGIALLGIGIAFLGVMVIGMTGAITALGDTLFPAESLSEGMQRDFSADAHFLERLRVWHPVVSIAVGFYVLFMAGLFGLLRQSPLVRRFALSLGILFVVQLAAGVINLLLLAPIAMQIIHLLLADLVWINLVLLGAAAFSESPERIKASAPILTD